MVCDSNILIYAAEPGDMLCLPLVQRVDALISCVTRGSLSGSTHSHFSGMYGEELESNVDGGRMKPTHPGRYFSGTPHMALARMPASNLSCYFHARYNEAGMDSAM
jgi:hypothetical protein